MKYIPAMQAMFRSKIYVNIRQTGNSRPLTAASVDLSISEYYKKLNYSQEHKRIYTVNQRGEMMTQW